MTPDGAPVGLTRDAFIAANSPIDRELRRLFPSLDARVIFDIGSCEGEDAIRYSRLFPDATIYAFEPVPGNVRLLREHVERWAPSRIEVREVALSDRSGTATLHVSSGHPPAAPVSDWDYGNKSSSLLEPDRHVEVHPWVRFDETITVPTDTIARVIEAEGIDRIDFVHLDVQGAELQVLAGAGPHLERIGAIWMEVEAIPLYAGQPLKGDVERFMADHGFRLMTSTVKKVSGDQLYVNPRIIQGVPALSPWPASPRRNRVKALLRRIPGVRPVARRVRRLPLGGVHHHQLPGAPAIGDRRMTADASPRITILTVSKDRALQLDGTLRSLASCCTDLDLATVYVLYRASTPRHAAAYRQLASEHPTVGLWPESSFRPDLIELVRGSDQVLFVVDDTIFLDTFSLATCAETLQADPKCLGFSLRLGTNTTYSYPSDTTLDPPPFEVAGSGVLTFEWNNAGRDFGYPLEVSSSLYRTSDVLPLLVQHRYDNPNSLERMLSRQAGSFAERRPRLACFERSVAVSVPANVVQTAFKNRHDSDPTLDAEALADAFDRGERLDVDRYRGLVTNACHQELEFTFTHDPATRTLSVEDAADAARAEIRLRQALGSQLPLALRRKNRKLLQTAARAAATQAAVAGEPWRGLQIALHGAWASRDWRLLRVALRIVVTMVPGGRRVIVAIRDRRRPRDRRPAGRPVPADAEGQPPRAG